MEDYLVDIYNSLGGEDALGTLEDFTYMMQSDDQYRNDVYNSYGEDVFGSKEDFDALVLEKESPTKDLLKDNHGEVKLENPWSKPAGLRVSIAESLKPENLKKKRLEQMLEEGVEEPMEEPKKEPTNPLFNINYTNDPVTNSLNSLIESEDNFEYKFYTGKGSDREGAKEFVQDYKDNLINSLFPKWLQQNQSESGIVNMETGNEVLDYDAAKVWGEDEKQGGLWWMNNWHRKNNSFIVKDAGIREDLTRDEFLMGSPGSKLFDVKLSSIEGLIPDALVYTEEAQKNDALNYRNKNIDKYQTMISQGINLGGAHAYNTAINITVASMLKNKGISADDIYLNEDGTLKQYGENGPVNTEVFKVINEARNEVARANNMTLATYQGSPLLGKINIIQSKILNVKKGLSSLKPTDDNVVNLESDLNILQKEYETLRNQYIEENKLGNKKWYDPTTGQHLTPETANQNQKDENEENDILAKKYSTIGLDQLYDLQNQDIGKLIYLAKEYKKFGREDEGFIFQVKDEIGGEVYDYQKTEALKALEKQANSTYLVEGLRYLPGDGLIAQEFNSTLKNLLAVQKAIEVNYDPTEGKNEAEFGDYIVESINNKLYSPAYAKASTGMMGYGVDEDKEIARTAEANAFADFVYSKLGAEQYKDITEDWGGGASEKGAHMTMDVLQLIGEFYLGRKALGAGMSTLNKYGSGTSLWYGLSGARAALGSNKITNGFYNISSAIVHEAAVIKARNEIVKPFGGDEMSLWWALGGAGASSVFKGAENWLMGARGVVPQTYREIATVVGKSDIASSIARGTLQPALGATTLIAGQIGENIIEFDKSVGQAWKEATTWENWVDSYLMVAGMQVANGSIGPRRIVRAFENDFNNYWRGTINTEANAAAKELGLTEQLQAEEEVEVNGKKIKQKTLTSETIEEAYNRKLKEEGLDGKESELTDEQRKRKQSLLKQRYRLNRLVDFNNLDIFIRAKYGRKRYADIVSVSNQLARGLDPNIDQLQTIADMPNLNEAVSIIMDPSGPFSGKGQGRTTKSIVDYLQSFKVFSDIVKKSLGQAGETLDAKSSAEFTKMFKDFMLEKAPLEQAISEAIAEGKSDGDVTFYNNKEYKLKDLKDLLQESVAGKLTEIQGKLAEKRFKQFEKVSQKFLDVLDGKTNISLEVLPSELFKTRLKSARDSGEIEEIKDQSNIELKDLVEGEGIYFTKSGKIFVNQDYAKDILNFTVTGHEVLHPIMNAVLGKMSAEKRINFINEFKQALPEEIRSIVQDRINKRQDITDKDFTVEWFNMTADALSELKGFNVSKIQGAGDAISNMFKRNINPDIEFNFGKNGADAFLFIKRYADFMSGKSDIVLEKSLPSLVEEGFKVDVDANVGSQRSVTTPEGKIIENLRDFDKLNWKKYNTKQEFQRSPEFIAATDFLYLSKAFDTQIKNKLFEGNPNDVKSDLAIHLSNFDPAQQKGEGGSLAAWMGSQFMNKVSGVGEKAKKAPKTVSADKPVGKAETPIAERVESKQDIESEVDATLEKPKKEVKVSVAKQVGLPETFAKGNNEGNSVNDYINRITDNINFSKVADLSMEGGRNQMISPFVRDLRSVVTSEASTLGADIAESMGIGKKYQQHLRDNFESIVKSQNPTYFSGLQARKGDMPKGMVQKSVGGEFNETTGEFEPKWTSDWVGKETDKGKVSTVGLSSNPEYVRINPNFNFKSKASQDQFINAFKPQMRKRGLATQMLSEAVVRDFAERIGKDPKLTKRFEDLTNTDAPMSKVAEQVSSQIAKSNWQRSNTARKFKDFSADAYLELFMPSFRNQLAKGILDISPENFTVKEVKKVIDNIYKDRVYNGELVSNDLRLGLAKDLHSTAGLLKAMKQNAANVGLKLEVDDVKWINKNLNRPFEENLKDLLNIPQSINLGGKKPNIGESNKLINQREQVDLTKKFFDQYIKKNKTPLAKAEALAKLYKFRGQYSDASKIGMGRDQYFSSVSDFVEKVIKPIAKQNNIKIKVNKSGGLQSIKVGKEEIDISKSMKQSVDALVKEEYFKPNGEIDINNPKVKELVSKNHEEADVAREILNDQFRFMSDKFHKGEIGPIDYALWTMSLKSSMETVLRAAGKLKYIYKPLDGEGVITIKGSGKNRAAYQNGKKLDLEKVSEALIYEHKRPAEHMIQSLSRLYLNADNIELTENGWDLNKKGKQELEDLYKDYTVSIIPKKGGFDDVITEIGYKDYDPTDMDRYFNERSLGDPRMRSLIDLQTGEIIGKEWGESAQIQYNKDLAIENTQNLPFQRSKTDKSNFEVLQEIGNHDAALRLARNPNKKVKKLRGFDFDDTLATSKSLVFYNKPNETGKPTPKNKAIFMIGGPGSGKTNIGKGLELGRDGFKVVNQDIFIEAEKAKAGLPEIEKDYTKEQRSQRAKIGAAGQKAAKAKLEKYTKAGDGMVIDGTGASYNATMKKVKALQEQGYEVFMVHAKTSNEVALERNAARKERSLPSKIVERTQKSVNENISKYRKDLGDNFMEIDTETIKYGEPLPPEFIANVKSRIYANERGRLNAEEFAKQGSKLIDEGFVMDFSDFNIVREGKRGPMFNIAERIRDARGVEDLFVITARAPESAPAIQAFLKSEGLNLPLKNIVGLGNSTGEAKAQWLVGKAAEGYNDFYFTDDALANVNAVKKALSVLDVKSAVQQANIQRSQTRSKEFNKLLEQTTGVEAFKEYSAAKAKVIGANKGKFKFWIPYSAEDFTGLIYPTLGRGRIGDLQMAWYKTNLLNPYSRAMENLSRDRVQMMADFKELKKELDVPKDLRKTNDSGFTNEQAVRVYLYNKAGHEIPGLSKTDLNELLDIVNSDGKLKAFADQIIGITKGDGYVKPSENWLVGTITTDLIDLLNTTKRSKYLEEWQNNVNEIYSKENLNKLEAIYGTKYREALVNSLARMKSGKNRLASGNRLSNQMLDFINGSNAAIMFFNTRSAALQSLSAANYINWSFNNPIKAGQAFANQGQYWKDFKTLMNSEYLVDRRNGLKLNIAESEIADAAATSKNKARAVLKYIQQKGYLPTQYMDSFAIASGGATFYRNRINDLVSKGMDVKQAEKLALKEWRDLAEISQQSSDPSKISQQQSSDAGRLILMFANTPMQYARLQKRAFQDLINGRGDAKSNISKIAYYGFVQNLLFNALQQSLFKLGFGDDEMDDKDEKRIYRTANGMFDTILRGLGVGGQAVSVGKNFLLDIYERSGRKRPEYVDSMWKLLQFSPPISSKISRLRQAAYAFDSKKRRQEIFDKGFSLDNPALMAGAKVISATANLPLDRVLQKYYNINAAMSDEAEWWQKLAMLGGWPAWDIMDKSSKKKTTTTTSTSFKPTKSKFKKKSFTPVRKKFQPSP